MSQATIYTPPTYTSPEEMRASWGGAERRSQEPIDLLSRSLNGLCLEAVDQYEIVAHLEALGYNSAKALARLGIDDHFALARELYSRTPRVRKERERAARHPQFADFVTPLSMALAFVVTFMLGALDDQTSLAPAITVLAWSQFGAALIERARGALDARAQLSVIALCMQVGAAGIAATWYLFRFGEETLLALLIWFGVAGLLWAEKRLPALALPLLVGALLVGSEYELITTEAAYYGAFATVAVCVLPVTFGFGALAALWVLRNLGATMHPLLYGVGQGLLILALVTSTPEGADPLPGIALLVAILLLSQRFLLFFKAGLAGRLWRARNPYTFASYGRRLLGAYSAGYLLPLCSVVGVYLLFGPQNWFYPWVAFTLFGLCLGLAIVAFSLGYPALPSGTFIVAGLAAALGAPLLIVCALLALVQVIFLARWLGNLGRYAIFLL